MATYSGGELLHAKKISKSETYEGFFENNKYHDRKGQLTLKNGDSYIGRFIEGKKHGKFSTKLAVY